MASVRTRRERRNMLSMDITPTKSLENLPSQCVNLDLDCKELRSRG